jgi:hypothetical protein
MHSALSVSYSFSALPENPPNMVEPRRCKAVRDYAAKNDDEITFKEGDMIFVPQKTDGLMWRGVFNGKVSEGGDQW